jgi:ligand-binding SRPBCC domain-containing protein
MAEGSVSEFSLWLGPFPIRWRAVHSDVGPHGFTDTQTQGPLATWQHTHHFEAIDGGTTRIHEHVEYEYARGLKGLLSRLLFSPIPLYFLFTYRKWATKRALEGSS